MSLPFAAASRDESGDVREPPSACQLSAEGAQGERRDTTWTGRPRQRASEARGYPLGYLVRGQPGAANRILARPAAAVASVEPACRDGSPPWATGATRQLCRHGRRSRGRRPLLGLAAGRHHARHRAAAVLLRTSTSWWRRSCGSRSAPASPVVRKVAANILMNTRKGVLQQLGMGRPAGSKWDRATPIDPTSRLLLDLPDTHRPDASAAELSELLRARLPRGRHHCRGLLAADPACPGQRRRRRPWHKAPVLRTGRADRRGRHHRRVPRVRDLRAHSAASGSAQHHRAGRGVRRREGAGVMWPRRRPQCASGDMTKPTGRAPTQNRACLPRDGGTP